MASEEKWQETALVVFRRQEAEENRVHVVWALCDSFGGITCDLASVLHRVGCYTSHGIVKDGWDCEGDQDVISLRKHIRKHPNRLAKALHEFKRWLCCIRRLA